MTAPGRVKKTQVIAFDLYGTLLSTDSIAAALAKHYPPEQTQSIATLWRRYQLEYTWRTNSMGGYKPFNEITRSALGHALAEHGLVLSSSRAESLMRAYDALHAFPEVSSAMKILEALSEETVQAFIFSNGTESMVSHSVKTSPELGPHEGLFQDLITVDALECYKPDPRCYMHLVERAGKKGETEDVWVVSANPFDVVGAKAAGLRAAFIDRSGRGWLDRLDEMRVPSLIAGDVKEAVQAILDY